MTELKAIYAGTVSQSLAELDSRSFCENLLFSLKMEQSDFKFGSNCIFFRSKQTDFVDNCVKRHKALKLWSIAAIWVILFLNRKGIEGN